MEIQWEMIILWNSFCISISTFYLVFKFRRDFAKLRDEVGEIKMILALDHESKMIIVSKDLEF